VTERALSIFAAFSCVAWHAAASTAHAFEGVPPERPHARMLQDAQDLGGAAHSAPRPPSDRTPEAARAALERGLAFLAAQQALEPEGSFPTTGARLTAPVAVTALGALAYMAGGSSPERGPQGRELATAIDYLIGRTELDPKAAHTGYISRQGDANSRMHGHGFAALALAQAYGMSPKSLRGARIARALSAALARIEMSQTVEGGWYYEPEKGLQHEGSITVCMVQALRAAHNAGLKVEPLTIARALDYLARSQKPDGSFRYALGQDDSSIALTAAAISTLNATGKYSGSAIDEGYAYLFREVAARELATTTSEPLCVLYERLYVAQALWQNADRRVFDDWIRKELASLLTSQRADGAWTDPKYGECYATAMNCLVLAVSEGLLPIFQR
jgi:hypothetical protein